MGLPGLILYINIILVSVSLQIETAASVVPRVLRVQFPALREDTQLHAGLCRRQLSRPVDESGAQRRRDL